MEFKAGDRVKLIKLALDITFLVDLVENGKVPTSEIPRLATLLQAMEQTADGNRDVSTEEVLEYLEFKYLESKYLPKS